MKKTLALILSVIMVLSIMPMAYAQRATYSPEIEEYIEDYLKVYTYVRNIYATPEQKIEVQSMIREAVDGKTEISPTYDNLTNIEADGRSEELTAFHEILKKAINEIEKKIAAGEIVIVLDTYEYWKLFMFLEGSYYSEEDMEILINRAENFNSDKYNKALIEAVEGNNEIESVTSGMGQGAMSTTMTQAEFDASVAKIKPLCDSIVACLDGNHPYGEYISNNDATEEADGTKTATCEFCGATDTITDEGTKFVKDDEPKEEPEEEKVSFFEMIFALIKEFFAKIFSIFK